MCERRYTDMETGAHTHRVTQRELLALLIRHFGVHEGTFGLSVDFKVAAVGAAGPTPDDTMPGIVFGISGVGIVPLDSQGSHTLDAAVCNPRPEPKRRTRKAKVAEEPA